jgi:hypothetical protein
VNLVFERSVLQVNTACNGASCIAGNQLSAFKHSRNWSIVLLTVSGYQLVADCQWVSTSMDYINSCSHSMLRQVCLHHMPESCWCLLCC